jgi:amidophosphoribosyltransferase
MIKLTDTVREECGVFAIHDKNEDVADRLYYGLMALQHRGQESTGISILNKKRLITRKFLGLASEALPPILHKLGGRLGIGHVRYSTVGTSTLINAQPFCVSEDGKKISFAHNGNIVNNIELRKWLTKHGRSLTSKSDAELIVKLLALELKKTSDIFSALESCATKIEGAFSAVMVTGDGKIIAARDPFGFKPLCEGEAGGAVAFASESVALDINGMKLSGDISPGEAVVASDDGIERKKFLSQKRRAHCMFEYVYFSRPDSIIDGRCVYEVRFKLGVNLAKTYEAEADVIVPVPDTSRTAAEGFSHETGIPVAEGLIKNRYVHRTFIMPRQKQRENATKIKLNPLKSVIEGRKIILIDDSIVRGTTSREIVNMLKKAGAREVHARITCPPIIAPCFYGIDIATHTELIAANRSLAEIQKIIGVDTLGYQTLDGLVNAIGLPKRDLCLACLTGLYPTAKAQEISDKMRRKTLSKRVRYWESYV